MHGIRHSQRWILLFIALTLAVSVVLTMLNRAFACDFEEPAPPEEARDEATAVFSGEVVDIGVLGDTEEYEVRFAVARVWKGVSEAAVSVRTSIDEGICGYPFEGGETYLVYAYGEPGELTTALFHRTTRWDRADADLTALGPGRPVDEVVVGDPAEAESNNSVWIFPVAIVTAGILVGVIMYLRRTRNAERAEDSEE